MIRTVIRQLHKRTTQRTTVQWKEQLLRDATTQRERDDVLAMFARYEEQQAA